MPAGAVLPERVPARLPVVVAGVAGTGAHQQERAVQAVLGEGREVHAGHPVRAGEVQLAVEVDARRDPRVVVHGLERGEAARRVAGHADPPQVERAGEAGGQARDLAQGRQTVQHETGVGDPDVHRLAQQRADVQARPADQAGEDRGGQGAVRERHLGRLVRVIDRHHHVAARRQVLDQRCPPGPRIAEPRRVQHHRPRPARQHRRALPGRTAGPRPVRTAGRDTVVEQGHAVRAAEVRPRRRSHVRGPLADRHRRVPDADHQPARLPGHPRVLAGRIGQRHLHRPHRERPRGRRELRPGLVRTVCGRQRRARRAHRCQYRRRHQQHRCHRPCPTAHRRSSSNSVDTKHRRRRGRARASYRRTKRRCRTTV